MSLVLLAAAGCCLFLASVFVFLSHRLFSNGVCIPAEEDWFEQGSVARYRPMERLLDSQELGFLRSQPGVTRKILRRFRTERIKLFRQYLYCLSKEYSRMGTAIKLMMVQSTYDRPDLVSLLVRQRIFFTYGLIMAELRLVLYVLGIGTVDVRQLVGALDSLQVELKSLMVPVHPAAA